MSSVFTNPLKELKEFEDMEQDLAKGSGPVQLSGCADSQKAHFISESSENLPWKLVVTYDDSRAREIYDDLRYFQPNTWLYPARDLLFYNADIHGNLMTKQRLQVLRHMAEDKSGIVVTTVDGLMDHLLPMDFIQSQAITVKAGQELNLEQWKDRLTAMGRCV